MEIIKDNIGLKELTQMENLSIRSFNICNWNGLNDLLGILSYFRENRSFSGLRNCGQKSNTELTELCLKYENWASKIVKVEQDNPFESLIDNLTPRQRKIINNLIEFQATNLSARSLNAVKKISESSLTLRGLKEIISPKYDISKINNIGEKSISELDIFFNEIREQIKIIHLFKNEDELTIELFHTYLQKQFDISQETFLQIFKNYDYKNGLPVFKTLDLIISSNYIFNNNELEIFNRGFNFWSDSLPEKLEVIASDINLTRERARQIRKKLLNEIALRFTFLRGLEFEALNLYGLNADSEIIVVDENLVEEIQLKESIKYNNIFITKILSIIYHTTHEVIGNIESLAFNIVKYKGADSRWNSIYLIKKELKESYDFASLVDDIKRRRSERIYEDYSFHFETYLTAFASDGAEINYYKITQIAEHIIFNEFTITIDLDDNITFNRNTTKQVFEYSIEALQALGEPSKVDIIYQKVKELYPNYKTDENSIRASMQRKNGFVPFGRTSVYGLKEWEEERNIRGGTIRDITEEYLMNQLEPKHIDDITNYVNKYRSTTSKNIYANLQMESNSRFKFYSGLFIGLKEKQYHKLKYSEVNERNVIVRTWEENFELLLSFTTQNSRLPYSSSKGEEKKRYRFMSVELNKKRKNQLEKSKAERLSELLIKYPIKRKK